MTGRYKAYPEYKDSGVEWVGGIPKQWQTTPLKRWLSESPCYGVLKPDKYEGEDAVHVIRIMDITANKTVADINQLEKISPMLSLEYKRTLIKTGDLILSVVGTLGRTFVCQPCHEGMNLSRALSRIKFKNQEHVKYVQYVISSKVFDDYVAVTCTGAAQKVLNMEDVNNWIIPFPPVNQINKIAVFLDHETAKIDTLIAKQEKLIELLKEKRQAVISHAVTKGLNPDAPMKDSGVEWLGQVPAHWVVSKLGLYAYKIGSGKTPRGGADVYQESGVLFLRSQNIYDDGLRIFEAEATYISDLIHSEMANTSVKPFDVLLNITGGSIGRTCIVPPVFAEANVNQHVCILRFSRNIAPYFANVMKSSSIKEQIDVVQVGGNREGLNFEQIANMKVCIPPKDEMNQINEFIQSQLFKLDELVQKANKTIVLMKERRTALISAAVTGKIDVRDFVVPPASQEEQA